MKLKIKFSFIVLIFPCFVFSQIDNKNDENTINRQETELIKTNKRREKKSKEKVSFTNNSFLTVNYTMLYENSTISLVGINYFYCKSYGFYTGFSTNNLDFNRPYSITAGFTKGLSNNAIFFVGGGTGKSVTDGYMANDYYSDFVAEGGFLFNIKGFVIQVGGGVHTLGFSKIGVGFKF